MIVVLVGEKTCNSRWVKYEIRKSIERGKGLLGIDISKIKDLQGNTSERCGQIPEGYKFYLGTRKTVIIIWAIGSKKQLRTPVSNIYWKQSNCAN